jgi:hypothetical protein
MRRSQFDHTIRAAGSILGEPEILVIGSRAVHGPLAELPPEAERSIEVDIAAFDDPDASNAELIDGSIGEASLFHQTFGYYAEGVSETTAALPPGWKDRLIRYESPMTKGTVAWCLDLHDLWLSKAVAGRPKDLEFCRALAQGGLMDQSVLRDRLESMADLTDPCSRSSRR